MRWSWLLLALLLSSAYAGGVEITSADRLELRKLDDHELVVIYGKPVKLLLEDGQEVEADTVEYDRQRRRLLLVGNVVYVDKDKRIIESDQLELYLEDESMDALKVHLRSGGVDLWGPEATRVLGQILMKDSRFTPCARCGQDPCDYSFSADKLVLYPGDRLIAYGVTVYVQDEPLFNLPLLMLHFSKRRPRLQIQHSDSDGWSLAADLPYVTAGGLGFTLLRYFQNRGWGFGVDHWGAGPAYEHYRALYLPPEVGAAAGSLDLDLNYREGDRQLRLQPSYTELRFKYDDAWPLPEKPRWSVLAAYQAKSTDGWRRSLRLERRDLPGKNRLWLSASARRESGPEPLASLRLKTYFDLGPVGPPAAVVLPEASLKWTKGWSGYGFGVKGSLTFGGYYDRTNELNRSARQKGVWAAAGRVLLDHADTYRLKNPWPGFSLSFENRFHGWYYDTGERQVDWRDRLSLEQRLGGLRLRAAAQRTVVEGEAFFARDYRRPVRQLTVTAAAQWKPLPVVSLETKGGWDAWQDRYQKLTSTISLTPPPFNFSASHVYDPQTGLHVSTRLNLGLHSGNFSASARSGYDYQHGKYDTLALKGSYALPGGSASASHSYDLNQGRSLKTSVGLSLQPGSDRYSLSESYDYQADKLSGRISAGWGPFSLALTHAFNLTGDAGSANFRQGDLGLEAVWREHKLLLSEHWDGRLGRFGPGSLSLDSRYKGLNRSWSLRARWHLPENGDEEFYLQTASLKGGLDLIRPSLEHPGFSIQGGLEYQRYAADDRQLKFKNFGFTAAWLADEHTRLFISALLSQQIRTSQGWPPLQPRIVFTLDRCCWALQFSLDAAASSAKIAFIYGGKSARFLFDQIGIHYPWEDLL